MVSFFLWLWLDRLKLLMHFLAFPFSCLSETWSFFLSGVSLFPCRMLSAGLFGYLTSQPPWEQFRISSSISSQISHDRYPWRMLVGTRLMGKMGYGNFRSGFLLVAGGLNMKICILLSSSLSCGQAWKIKYWEFVMLFFFYLFKFLLQPDGSGDSILIDDWTICLTGLSFSRLFKQAVSIVDWI